MGIGPSNSWNFDKKLCKKLIDDSVWFTAKIIEFHINSYPAKSYRKSEDRLSKTKRKLSSKKHDYSGRISVKDDCIVFQSINRIDFLVDNSNCYDRFINKVQSTSSPTTQSSPNHASNNNNNIFSFAHCPQYKIQQSTPTPSSSSPTSSSSNSKQNNNSNNNLNSSLQNHTISWPLSTIRKFCYYGNLFSFETGRMSPTGESRFTFKIKNFHTFYRNFENTQYSLDRSPLKEFVMTQSEISSPITTRSNSFNDHNPRIRHRSFGNSQSNHTVQKSHSFRNIYELTNLRNSRPTSTSPLDFTKLKRGSQSIGDFEQHYQNIAVMQDELNESPKYVSFPISTNQNEDYQSNPTNPNQLAYSDLDFLHQSSNDDGYVTPLSCATPTYTNICTSPASSVSPQPSQQPSIPSISPSAAVLPSNYLVICENHTRAVEQVMKRIK